MRLSRNSILASTLAFLPLATLPDSAIPPEDFLTGLESQLRAKPEVVRIAEGLKTKRAEIASLKAEKRALKVDSRENREKIRLLNARIESAEKEMRTLDRSLERGLDAFLDGVYQTSPELQALDRADRLEKTIARISVATDPSAFTAENFAWQGAETCAVEIPCPAAAGHATDLHFYGKAEALAIAADLTARLEALFGNPVAKAKARKFLLRALDPGNR